MKKKKSKVVVGAIATKFNSPSEKFKIKFERCYLCGEFLSPQNTNVDHIIPLIKGGMNVQENKKYTHVRCNTLKSWRDIFPKQEAIGLNAFYRTQKDVIKLMLIRRVFDIHRHEKFSSVFISKDDYRHLCLVFDLYRVKYESIDFDNAPKCVGYLPATVKLKTFDKSYVFTRYENERLSDYLTSVIYEELEASEVADC